MAVMTEKGLVVVTGCSHAGVCNIIEHAKKVTGEPKVFAVIGGFHLSEDMDRIGQTIAYFRQSDIQMLFPMHCTGEPAKIRFHEAFRSREPLTGETLEL